MKAYVALAVALAFALPGSVAASGGRLAGSVAFLAAAQQADGGFAEAGRQSDSSLTAWAGLGLVAAGGSEEARARALDYLQAHTGDVRSATDIALAALARVALGDRPDELLPRLRALETGPLVNAEIWAVLALRAAGEPAPLPLVRALLAAQARSGGWSWVRGGAPDSNDTAAAIEALRAAGVSGAPISRGLAALRAFRNRDGGYGLTRGRDSDAQSTAWAIQALLAAGVKPGRPTWRFLARLRRSDGSYRYSVRYATTPVWVTAQVAPALAGKPYPFPDPGP